jgi:protein-S-isoprenylcysteine O-methyltransferase Ste14
MSFRFYTNAISQVSRAAAAGIFILGLMLVGFALLIYALPRFFATLAAIVFFVAGLGCGITAVKIFLAQRRLDKFTSSDSDAYRKNVRIHIEEHHEQ